MYFTSNAQFLHQVRRECPHGFEVPTPPSDAERGQLQEERGGGGAEHAQEDYGRRHATQALDGEEGRIKGIELI